MCEHDPGNAIPNAHLEGETPASQQGQTDTSHAVSSQLPWFCLLVRVTYFSWWRGVIPLRRVMVKSKSSWRFLCVGNSSSGKAAEGRGFGVTVT